MTNEPLKLWIWRNVRLCIPADWEMLQFSRTMAEGRCAFADRYRFRLELSWQAAASEPDFDRMMSDYAARLREQAEEAPRRLDGTPWHGLESKVNGVVTTRFGRFLPGEKCVVEVVLLWPEGRDEALERAVLTSVAPEPPHNGLHRWRAFGMDVLADSRLALAGCRVEPANAEMIFTDQAGETVERFARRGMVSEWLTEPVAAWLRRHAPAHADVSASTVRQAEHDVACLVSEERAPGLRGRLGRRRRREAAAWICPKDGRLYSVLRTALGAAHGEPSDFFGRRLACCREVQA